jgi:small subunit ribosomal protein S17
MADENTNEETQDEAAAEPEAETTDAPEGVADVENVPEEAAPEEPETAEPEPAEAPPAAEAEPEQAAEAEPTEEPTEEPATEEPATEEPAAEAEAEAEAPAAPAPKKKRKRLPRSLRRQRSKATRERPAERKPIARLPKPEHERGRRQERQGTVVSAGSDKTIVVRVDVVKVHPMYKKVIRRSTKLHAHDEENQARVGDIVRLVETRPLSKLKRWRLQEVVEAAK